MQKPAILYRLGGKIFQEFKGKSPAKAPKGQASMEVKLSGKETQLSSEIVG
jgi:hypothetical protein